MDTVVAAAPTHPQSSTATVRRLINNATKYVYMYIHVAYSRKFRDWLREIDRAGAIVDATDERYKSFVLQTLRGNAADFLSRVLRLTPDITWARLRESLIQQYSDTGDARIAKTKLRRLTQRI